MFILLFLLQLVLRTGYYNNLEIFFALIKNADQWFLAHYQGVCYLTTTLSLRLILERFSKVRFHILSTSPTQGNPYSMFCLYGLPILDISCKCDFIQCVWPPKIGFFHTAS